MSFDTDWTKTRVGDEIGFSDRDLALLYGVDVGDLDDHLDSLEEDKSMIWQRIIADVDALRFGYRIYEITDQHIAALQEQLSTYHFGSPILTVMAGGMVGWRLNPDDAIEVAEMAAEVVAIDSQYVDELAARVMRIAMWPTITLPEDRASLVDRVVDVTTYLVELAGVL